MYFIVSSLGRVLIGWTPLLLTVKFLHLQDKLQSIDGSYIKY